MKNIQDSENDSIISAGAGAKLTQFGFIALYGLLGLVGLNFVGQWAGNGSGLHILKNGFQNTQPMSQPPAAVPSETVGKDIPPASAIGTIRGNQKQSEGDSQVNGGNHKRPAAQEHGSSFSAMPFAIRISDPPMMSSKNLDSNHSHLTSSIHFEMLDKLASLSIAAHVPQNVTTVRKIKDLESLRLKCQACQNRYSTSDELTDEFKSDLTKHCSLVLGAKQYSKLRESVLETIANTSGLADLEKEITALQRFLYEDIVIPKPVNTSEKYAAAQAQGFNQGVRTYERHSLNVKKQIRNALDEASAEAAIIAAQQSKDAVKSKEVSKKAQTSNNAVNAKTEAQPEVDSKQN